LKSLRTGCTEEAEVIRVGPGELEEDRAHPLRFLPSADLLFDAVPVESLQHADLTKDDGEEERVLILEIEVEGRFVQADFLRDPLHRNTGEPALDEELLRTVEDVLPTLFALFPNQFLE